MTPERWAKIEDVFQSALDLSGAERERFIRAEAGGDADLVAEVERLVARYETEETFLESPVWTDSLLMQPSLKQQIAVSLEEELPSVVRREESAIGRQIGAYRLTEEIGKGGMGVVYAAERADGEFYQKVAVKLIKRGMDTDFIIKRFRHERQIAATLNHPNIARLFDGGTTGDGLPYFVLEFIEGEPFFRYSEKKKLDLRQKLELFLRVCAAVAYAHGKQIIHRDIKPGNILVGESGEPKLLDFGIAKILDPDLIHESVMPTATQMRLMTPEYASPEQARGDEITPASDQYSLGVLLYELLTGARPYKFPSRAPHEIARVICEEIPSEPSSGEFGKMMTGDLVFDKDFCRKLDRIVLKSLRKNPLERYASVKDFAADIERFLRNEPVLAESFAEAKAALGIERENLKLPPANQKSIAVLPFKVLDTLGGAAKTDGDGFLAVGLADALITRLSNVKQFLVRPTSSILSYGERAADSFAAGEELKVQYVLDGSIIKTENRIRVSVQLLNVSEQTTVWAERFDENLTDVLTLEDSISARVAESLVPQLTTRERVNLSKRGTDNTAAYEAYLRGRYCWNLFTEDGFRQAIAFYNEAVELDPDYALAHAAIADYYVWLGVYGVVPPGDCYPPAKVAALRAIEIDDKLAEAYSALGLARLYGDYDWEQGEKDILRAIELNPNNAVAHLWYSHNLFTQGRFAEGQPHVERAVELDPLAFQNQNTLSWSYFLTRRFDDALRKAEEVVERFPAISHSHFSKAHYLNRVGRSDEAMTAIKRAMELSDDSLFTVYGLGLTLAAAGKREEAVALIEKTEAEAERKYFSYYQVALVYCYLKDKDKAFEYLNRAYENRETLLIWVGVEPSLDPLRDDARYVEFLKRINHPTLETIYKKPTEQRTLIKDSENKSVASEQKSIAVLPFKILNEVTGEDTGGSEFLGVGLADALITRLSNVRRFVVRPTSSVLRFGQDGADSFAAGQELDVGFVLDGNILRAGKRVRVSVQLLDVEKQSTVWAERFDEDFTDFLSLEDAISTKVAELLVSQLTSGEIEDLAKRGTDNAKAHEAYLRGRYHWNTFTENSFAQAFAAYQEAIEHDPNYALAHAGIADYYIWLGIFGVLPPKQTYRPAIRSALRAVEIDPKLSEAYAALGFARLCGDYDWEQSEKDIRRAVFLNPNYAVAHNWLAILLYTAARFEEGLEHARRAVELDPLTYQNYRTLSWGFYFSRRFEEALAEIDRTIERFPLSGVAYANRSWALRAMGRTAEAAASSKKASEIAGGAIFVLFGHAQSLAADGRRAEALESVRRIETDEKTRYVSLYQVALVYCHLGEIEKALEALEAALADGEGWLVWLAVEPALDILRGERRFKEILQRVKSPAAPHKISSSEIAAAAATPTAERLMAPRRAGIKQGVFLIVVSFLLLPILVALVAGIDSLRPMHLFVTFLLVFGGGLARIIYAFLFEPKSGYAPGDSASNLDISLSSRPTLILGESRTSAEPLSPPDGAQQRWMRRSLYGLAAVSVLSFGYVVYHVVSHLKIDSVPKFEIGEPPNRRWRDNFASVMDVRRLTTSGAASGAAVSPDGTLAAYFSEENGRQSLWIKPIDGGEARQLVTGGAVTFKNLIFSPDGGDVYYTSVAAGETAPQLFRVSAAGGAALKVSEWANTEIGFAPDGRRIAYFGFNPKTRVRSLYVAEIDENKQIQPPVELTTRQFPVYIHGTPKFSPDGQRIAFVSSDGSDQERSSKVSVFDLASRAEQTLENAGFFIVSAIEWRANGREIVLTGSETGAAASQIWLVAYPSGEKYKLTNDLNNYYGVSLSNDSNALLTTRSETTMNIESVNLDAAPGAFTLVRQITDGGGRQDGLKGLKWTANNKILYIAGTLTENILTQTEADGANRQTISTGDLLPAAPLLTADNRYLFFINEKDDDWAIWRRDQTTGELRKLTEGNAMTPTLTPDERFLIYAAKGSGDKLTLHRVSIEGGDETELTSAFCLRPAVSPDGRLIACQYNGAQTDNQWEIAVLNINGGVPVRVIRPPETVNLLTPFERALAWSPDSRAVFYVNDRGASNVFRVNVEGNAAPVQMTHFTAGRIFDFSVAPDGKRAILARGATSSDVVIFKNSK